MFSLGIEIGAELLAKQFGWFAPKKQPFLVPETLAEQLGISAFSGELSAEVRDTFEIYRIPQGLKCLLLGKRTSTSSLAPSGP